MPEILFASNSVSHFPGSITSSSDWAYDQNRVPYAIHCPYGTVCGSPEFKQTTGDETWFHFKCGADNGWPNNYGERIVEINDIEGNQIVFLAFDSSSDDGYRLFFSTGNEVLFNNDFLPWPGAQSRTFDIQILFTNVQAECRVYVNEILVLELIGPVSQRRYPRYMLIGGHTDGLEGSKYSEIIVADGDTRNARLDLLRPVSQGTYNDWLGPIGYLADDDPTTGMTTLASLQKQSTNLTPYGGAENISNVVQVTTTVRGINAPDLLRHLIRLSVTDYESIDYSIPFEKDYQVTDWNVNPATDVPWTGADLANAQFGFISDENP